MFKIKFLGVGGGFAGTAQFQSNMVIQAENGKKLLLDAGTLVEVAMQEQNMSFKDIDDIYISHLHTDHYGGLEMLGFKKFFIEKRKPRLFLHETLVNPLWNALKVGMETLDDRVANIYDYFDVKPCTQTFEWEGLGFSLIRNKHVVNSLQTMFSFGLVITDLKKQTRVYITTDTIFNNDTYLGQISDVVFHDCDVSNKGTVHARYNELMTLPSHIKAKMWLYHYGSNPTQDAVADGFKGFVQKGQEFEFK